jgi:hypothetical protein
VSGGIGIGNTAATSGYVLDATGNVILSAANPEIRLNNGGSWLSGGSNTMFIGTSGTAGSSGAVLTVNNTGALICSGGACGSSQNGAGTLTVERAVVTEEASIGTTGAITVNWDDGNQQRVNSSTGNMTFSFSNATAGQTLRLVVCFGGAHTITWPTIRWAGGTAPTPTSTSGKCDVFSFLYTGTEYFGQSSLNF